MAARYGRYLIKWRHKGKRFIFPHGEVMIHQPSGGEIKYQRRPGDHGKVRSKAS
ncbi:MAG: ATP-dependent Clp protease proteolytic subunit [Chitinophagaceae bacterium]|nr:ATP-dependent Clp protease proteolytic subunit [Chitinophagaceae bacterium]